MTIKHEHLNLAAVALLIVLCVSWGMQQVLIKVAIPGVTPVWQAGIRSIGATVLVGGWMLATGRPIFGKDGTLWWGIVAGILFALEFMLIFWGLEYTYASRGVIFLYLSPFVVAIGVQLFIPGENLRLIQVVGLVCAFSGILLFFGESLSLPSERVLIGDAMLIGAAVLWGATTVVVKAGPLAIIAPAKTLLYQLAVSAVILPIGAVALGESGLGEITPVVIGSILFQTLWIASVTYLAWFWLIRHYPAAHVTSFTFLTPLLGVAAGGVLLDEPLSAILLVALALVGSGIYLVNRPAAKKEPIADPI